MASIQYFGTLWHTLEVVWGEPGVLGRGKPFGCGLWLFAGMISYGFKNWPCDSACSPLIALSFSLSSQIVTNIRLIHYQFYMSLHTHPALYHFRPKN